MSQNCRSIFFSALDGSAIHGDGEFGSSAALFPIWRLRMANMIENNVPRTDLQNEVYGQTWREQCHHQIHSRAESNDFVPRDFH
jgi:hypothetical protein